MLSGWLANLPYKTREELPVIRPYSLASIRLNYLWTPIMVTGERRGWNGANVRIRLEGSVLTGRAVTEFQSYWRLLVRSPEDARHLLCDMLSR
jgi:hypothetical protein